MKTETFEEQYLSIKIICEKENDPGMAQTLNQMSQWYSILEYVESNSSHFHSHKSSPFVFQLLLLPKFNSKPHPVVELQCLSRCGKVTDFKEVLCSFPRARIGKCSSSTFV